MPYGGNDWLALTQEPTLEPELPICDPHHHFWDFRTERVPYQRYLLHELVADVGAGHNVRSTVFIEARSMYRADGPTDLRSVGEVEFVQQIALIRDALGAEIPEMMMRIADRQLRLQGRFLGQRQPVVSSVGHSGSSLMLIFLGLARQHSRQGWVEQSREEGLR